MSEKSQLWPLAVNLEFSLEWSELSTRPLPAAQCYIAIALNRME